MEERQLTDAEERQKELEELGSRDGQAREFRDALMQALTATNLEITGQGVKPRIDSVIQALTMLQAEFVAMEPERGTRRRRIAEIEHNLTKLVSMRVSMGQKAAKPMPPDQVN